MKQTFKSLHYAFSILTETNNFAHHINNTNIERLYNLKYKNYVITKSLINLTEALLKHKPDYFSSVITFIYVFISLYYKV